MTFHEVIEYIGRGVEGLGVAIIVIGTVVVLARLGVQVLRLGSVKDGYHAARRGIGRALLLGLEVLVAGDIIRTVAVAPTLAAATTLAIIVLIRTFLSWSIELETEGRWPWQKQSDGSDGSGGSGGS